MVRNKIVIDANFFLALYNPSDQLHSSAFKMAERLQEGNVSIILPILIFSEVMTLVSQRIGKAQALEIGDEIRTNKKIRIEYLNSRSESEIYSVFSEIKKKNMSYADCSILTTIKKYDVRKLLSFDKKDFGSFQDSFSFTFY
ncbi:MAG: type II toxin-antitoxin system VapC family toxin [Candidatus Roizmanbacteria bacterium]